MLARVRALVLAPVLPLLLLSASLAALAALAVQAAGVASVSPQGEVVAVRRVVVRFDAAVVPFGDPRLPDPMVVASEGATPPGSGRWIDARSWAQELRQALPPGSRCSVRPRGDWQPLGGALTGTTPFNFNTGGPAMVRVWPYEGSQIEEDQHFLLGLSGPVVVASLVGHARCEVEGLGERMPVRVVSGAPRDAVIQARGLVQQADRLLLPDCQRPLPNGAAVRLVWGAGIAAAANPKVLTRAAMTFRTTVRPAFTAEFSCERERANAPCLPVRPMSLRFSEPVGPGPWYSRCACSRPPARRWRRCSTATTGPPRCRPSASRSPWPTAPASRSNCRRA